MGLGARPRARQSGLMDPDDAEAHRALQRTIRALFAAGPVRERWLMWADSLVAPLPSPTAPADRHHDRESSRLALHQISTEACVVSPLPGQRSAPRTIE